MPRSSILALKRQAMFALVSVLIIFALLAGLRAPSEPVMPAAAPVNPTFQPVATGSPLEADALVAILPVANRNDSLRRLARQAATTESPAQALMMASDTLSAMRRHGDDRLGGYAESLLLSDALSEQTRARLMLADLYQYQHRFDQAERQLSALRADQPNDVQTWLLSANVARVQGRIGAAKSACETADRLSRSAWTIACKTDIAILTGQAGVYERALDELKKLPDYRQHRSSSLAVWLADIADRAGQTAAAERHFRQAMVLGPGPYELDRYLRFLLTQQKAQTAQQLLQWWQQGRDRVSALNLLNAAIIAKALGERARAESLAAQFKHRVDEQGKTKHWRELTRYWLAFEADTQMALQQARRNWANQKEPIDALLLARAANAQGATGVLRNLEQELQARRMISVLNRLSIGA